MGKILKSKIFLMLTPIINFVLFFVAGFLLGKQPNVHGLQLTQTDYLFSIERAVGIWLIGLAVSLLVLLICILIRKISLQTSNNN